MWKPVGLLAAAVVLGVVMSLLKGTGGGTRLEAGNLGRQSFPQTPLLWLGEIAVGMIAMAAVLRRSRTD